MTLSDYRSNPYWKAAVDLGPTLVRLADELPASEANGISQILRHVATELPAAIAADLMDNGNTRQAPALKLAAAVELIDKVYPALDTAAGRAAVDALLEKLFAPDFGGEAPAAQPQVSVAPASAPEIPAPTLAPAPAAVENLAPAEVPAQPAPTTVTVQPQISTEPTSQPAPMFSRFGPTQN